MMKRISLGLKQQVGLTLIEMMTVVAILGIVGSIAIPAMSGYVQRAKLKGIAAEMQRNLQMARSEAARNNRPVLLTVSTGTNQCYGLTANSTACDCTVSSTSASNYCEIKRISATDLNLITLATGIDVSLTQGGTTGTSGTFTNIGFDPVRAMPYSTNGTAFTYQTLKLTSKNSEVLNLVLSATGKVTICTPSGVGAVPSFNTAC
ncbi:pilus assembly FimT family protein [Andreprevotia chitinilytica]|uniref:pilus assembly FimT family protein n=1 Tax=Andreprevotia chitinilytica TaxID=396808 RepID=UPI00068FBF18|nr:GspH/FimT family pseudopilin [Andreprevotia chitinilytica]